MGDGHRSRVLITGTFCSLNKGDAAMRIALTDELRKSMPGCHISIMTPFPDLDRGAYKCDSLIPCSRRIPKRAISMFLRASLWNLAHRLLGSKADRLLDDELREYRRSSVVVDLSGDGLTEEYGLKCLVAHMVPVVIGKLLCRPVFVCAQTIGPFQKHKWLCRFILKRSDAVTARESLTMEYLTGLGLTPKRLSLTADLAFLMEPSSREDALRVLQEEEVPLDKPLVGFAVSRLPGHILGTEDGRKPSKLELELAETLDRLIAMGLRPVFISHTTGPGERRDDRRAAARVTSLCQSQSEVSVLSGDYPAELTKALIREMDLMVGVRMHSCIAALSTNVPTVCIAYGPKAFGIMQQSGQAERLIDIREVTADRLFPVIRDTWEHREDVKQSLSSAMTKVKAMARENVRIVSELVQPTYEN